jgi:hypothetical protein
VRGLLLILPVLLGLLAERAIRRSRPLWLVPFAFVPIGRSRRFELSDDVAAGATDQPERPYRRAARGAPDASRLPLTERSERDGTVLQGRGDVVAVSSPDHYAVARIDVSVRGESAILRARCLPVPLSILGWSALLALTSRGSPWISALAVLIPIGIGVASYLRIRSHVAAAMDEIERRLSRG